MDNHKGKPIGRGTRKVRERVEYRGSYRIVGTVWNGKEMVGYAVIDSKTYAMRLFTTVQTKQLLAQSKFENAIIENGEISNTECSMNRLLKFDQRQNVVGNFGLTILGKIYMGTNRSAGFRVMDATGKVLDLSETGLTRLLNTNVLLNAKEVPTPNGDGVIISAIKGNFKRIEKEITEDEDGEEQKSHEAWVKEQHAIYLDKAIYSFYSELFTYGYIAPITTDAKKKKAKIVTKEFVLPNYPSLRKAKDVIPEMVIEAGLLLYWLQHGDKRFRRGRTISGIKTHAENDFAHSYLPTRENPVKKPFVTPEFIDLIDSLDSTRDVRKYFRYREHIVRNKMEKVTHNGIKDPKIFKLVDSFRNSRAAKAKRDAVKLPALMGFNPSDIEYSDTEGIAQLGYTIEKEKVGEAFPSKIYGVKPLRFLFDGLSLDNEQENFMLDNINTFGDVELFRKIGNYLDRANNGLATPYKKAAEGLLIILAMHNPEIAKFTLTFYNGSMGQFSNIDIDSISRENYFLREEDKLFYESGAKFNRSVHLDMNSHWGELDLNVIPQATFEAICVNARNDEGYEFPRKFPHIRS